MDLSTERTQRTYIKLTLGALVGLLAFIFLCYFGYRSYSAFESKRQVRRAAAFLSGGDFRKAVLSALRAQQLDPQNVEAVRQLAQIAETSGDKTALDWRRKACELQPRNADDALALVTCAVQFKDIELADKALDRFDKGSRETPEFHIAAARLAEAKKDLPGAAQNWEEAIRLVPANTAYQLQYAMALLRMNDRTKWERARAMLEQLRSDPAQRASATRALLADSAAHSHDADRLVTLAQELQSYSEALFSDRILYLDILHQVHDSRFAAYLTNVERDASSKPTDLASLFSWMNANGLSLLAIDFARTLPPDIMTKWPVPLAIAQSYARLADWPALEACVKSGNWGEFDFLRHAHLALAYRGENKSTLADREWTVASRQAESHPQFLSMLSRETAGWGWRKETSDLLWAMTKHPDARMDALQSLYQAAVETGDTPGLYRVLLRMNELKPDDRMLQNNLAQVSLLLHTNTARAQTLAAELYRQEPSNPAYASTFAYALYTKGDIRGALKALDELGENRLREPSVAAYYGVILAASGDTARARDFLKLAGSAKLIPEEKALVAKAESAIK